VSRTVIGGLLGGSAEDPNPSAEPPSGNPSDDVSTAAGTTYVVAVEVRVPGCCDRPAYVGGTVSDHVYRLSEIVGSSPTSVDDAIRTAIAKAAQTVRNIEWFQTEEIRGQVVDGGVAYFQVRLKIGFRVD
jgi:flavin-binding protein dodecin